MAISDRTKRLLWSSSAGYCQNPGCHNYFFVFFKDGSISSLEELAHVIGRHEKGPRGISYLDTTERDAYENIILLCPTCHTLIDKNPLQFSVEMLHDWKQQHEEAIKRTFVVPIYQDREALAKAVHNLLRKNKVIFMQYGPHSSNVTNPLADEVEVWIRYVISDIIPNNHKIADLLNENEHLLSDDEKDVFDKFILHQQAFEYNHISGDKTSAAPLFPEEMNKILRG